MHFVGGGEIYEVTRRGRSRWRRGRSSTVTRRSRSRHSGNCTSCPCLHRSLAAAPTDAYCLARIFTKYQTGCGLDGFCLQFGRKDLLAWLVLVDFSSVLRPSSWDQVTWWALPAANYLSRFSLEGSGPGEIMAPSGSRGLVCLLNNFLEKCSNNSLCGRRLIKASRFDPVITW